MDLKSVYYQFFGVVGLPVGLVAGFGLHYGLNPLVFGTKGSFSSSRDRYFASSIFYARAGVAWQSRSLPAFVGLMVAALGYFGLARSMQI